MLDGVRCLPGKALAVAANPNVRAEPAILRS
jgi:hypothetical protein